MMWKIRKKILMIGTHPDARGGISAVIGAYRDCGMLPQVMYMASYREGCFIHKIGYFVIFLYKYVFLLLQQPSIRVVHVHTASGGSFLRKSVIVIIARVLGRKSIIHIHGAGFREYFWQSPYWFRAFIRKVLNTADAIIALSLNWRKEIAEIAQRQDIRVIYNPTTTHFSVRPEKNTDEVRFLFLGRLGQRKGAYDLIEAMRFVKTPNTGLYLYGDGELEKVQARVKSLQLQDRVHVGGWIAHSQKEAVLSSTDVLVLPSYYEGLPVSILEALSWGLPVISTPVGGIPEAVIDGKNGYLIEPGDVQALAGKIEQLAQNAHLRRQMGNESRLLAVQRFEIRQVVLALEGLYDHLLQPA